MYRRYLGISAVALAGLIALADNAAAQEKRQGSGERREGTSSGERREGTSSGERREGAGRADAQRRLRVDRGAPDDVPGLDAPGTDGGVSAPAIERVGDAD